jgi:ubiquinone/menaquinone biosynthesis C-methylase UbiE
MMEDVKKTYTEFHKSHSSKHLYPTEWVIRTMLGNYARLKLDRSKYKGGKILDLGFGDCRNMPLLNNCDFNIYGIEITDETVALGYNTLKNLNIKATLKTGRSTNIPFEDNFFDYILACASSYYIDKGHTFADNLKEITRVLRPSGYLIANFPAFTSINGIAPSFILDKSIPTDDGHVIIQNDIFGLRNGYKFKAFHSMDELKETFSPLYTDISTGECFEDYYGLQINIYTLCAKKK